MRFVVVDNCPVPSQIADEIREIKRRSGSTLVSCYRGEDAEPLLAKLGKMSQRQLFDGFSRGLAGFNPANRPRQSTHECYSDGVAYRGPVGRRLKEWQVGQDWLPEDVSDIIKAYAAVGWRAVLTYPGRKGEEQHVNVVHKGREFIPFITIRNGSRGRKVRYVRWALGYIHDPDTEKPYLEPGSRLRRVSPKFRARFGDSLEHAVKKFQRDHGQKADGIVGRQTWAQLKTSVRRRKRKLKEKKR